MANRQTESAPRGGMPQIFWIIVAVATLLAVILVLFLILRGYQDGIRRSEAQGRQQIAILLQNAQDLQAEGQPREALTEYQKVLSLDPENEDAIRGIGRLLDPQATATPEPPTPAPPSPTPTLLNPIEIVWADAQAHYNAGRWQEAIDRLLQVRATQADFHADEGDEMLYTAYVSLGTEKSNAGGLEEAVQLFDKALALRPDAVQIRTIRDVTAQYVDALTYWFADWPKVIELLDDLYRRSPGYRDVRQRLQQAHVEYGDSLARQGDWCAAAAEYDSAIAVQDGPGLGVKFDELTVLCAQGEKAAEEAGPEDGASPGDGSPGAEAGTDAGTEPVPVGNLSGLGTGRILYSSQDEVDGRHRIWAQPVTASVRPVFLVEDAMQPHLRADGQRLAFRSMRGDSRGLGSLDPATELRLRFTIFAEDILPNWNAEGNRLAFASNREGDRRWRLYTAWADGNDNGSAVVFGEDPDWHPAADLIAYRGCDERGNNCGLRVMRSDGGDQASLTQVPGDARPEWSPDGRSVVFMSAARHGNWEIYRVDVQTGAVARLTDSPGLDVLPTVSPDGRRVAFLSNRTGVWQIFVKPISGGAAQLLAPIEGQLPIWQEANLHWVP